VDAGNEHETVAATLRYSVSFSVYFVVVLFFPLVTQMRVIALNDYLLTYSHKGRSANEKECIIYVSGELHVLLRFHLAANEERRVIR